VPVEVACRISGQAGSGATQIDPQLGRWASHDPVAPQRSKRARLPSQGLVDVPSSADGASGRWTRRWRSSWSVISSSGQPPETSQRAGTVQMKELHARLSPPCHSGSGNHLQKGLGPPLAAMPRDMLQQLGPGDAVLLVDDVGNVVIYHVVFTAWYDTNTDQVDDIFGSTTDEEVTLITCGGAFDQAAHQYLSRLVVRAVRDQASPFGQLSATSN